MFKEPEDEAFDELEKAQQRKGLLVDKGCAERGCMGYDDRDGDKPIKMRVFEDDDIQDYKKPWVGLTRDEQSFVYSSLHSATSRKDSFWVDFANAIEAKLKEKNT